LQQISAEVYNLTEV